MPGTKVQNRILRDLSELEVLLNQFRFERKTSQISQLAKIKTRVRELKSLFEMHARLENEQLFPYLDRHVPKMVLLTRLLRMEHLHLAGSFRDFFLLLQRYPAIKTRSCQGAMMQKIQDKGNYLICILRRHFEIERSDIYDSMNTLLKPKERQEIEKLYKIFYKSWSLGSRLARTQVR